MTLNVGCELFVVRESNFIYTRHDLILTALRYYIVDDAEISCSNIILGSKEHPSLCSYPSK